MTKVQNYDIVIVGGGPAGLGMATLLGNTTNLRVACVDQGPEDLTSINDLRTTAISYGSSRILNRAGVWDGLEEKSCPIEDIEILDGSSPVLLQFLSTEANGQAFGWICENADMREAFAAGIARMDHVERIAPARVADFEIHEDHAHVILEDGRILEAKLVIGADGRGSFTREWMNIPTRQWSYKQRAVICNVTHEHPHNSKAVEHFWPEGPFAILPLNDDAQGRHCSSVVFTEHGPKQNTLMNMSDAVFETALQARFPGSYGAVRMATKRQIYPLGLIHAARYTGPRMALIADAGHGIHPIAGQGLNLGFRDIGKLGQLIEEAIEAGDDIAAPALLERYEGHRRIDNVAMIAVTDGLVRLFSNNLPPVRFLRRIGLKAVSKLPPAKRFFMREAMGDR